jgi:hypothetical protein
MIDWMNGYWMRGDKYRVSSKEWFEKECIIQDGWYRHRIYQSQGLPQEAVDKYAGEVLELWSRAGGDTFVMREENEELTTTNDGRQIAWSLLFFDELVDRDWIRYDVRMEEQRCALNRDYFYETYYKPVKIDKKI